MIDVSIIITTKNEADHIVPCLESIRNQDYAADRVEVIVVDNNSTDTTKEMAASHGAQVYNLGPERSAQRNFGVSKAAGRYILYLDADMQLSKTVVSECVEKCEEDDLVALYIPERIKGRGFWVKVRDFERSFYDATCIDCVRFVRRDKFLEVGGFDENLTGPEDWDFDRRVRSAGKVALIRSPLYHNEEGFRVKGYLSKKKYYAKNFDNYIKKWGKTDAEIRKQLGFWYRYFGVFTEDKKVFKLLSHPVLALGMYILRASVGIAYLMNHNRGRD